MFQILLMSGASVLEHHAGFPVSSFWQVLFSLKKLPLLTEPVCRTCAGLQNLSLSAKSLSIGPLSAASVLFCFSQNLDLSAELTIACPSCSHLPNAGFECFPRLHLDPELDHAERAFACFKSLPLPRKHFSD